VDRELHFFSDFCYCRVHSVPGLVARQHLHSVTSVVTPDRRGTFAAGYPPRKRPPISPGALPVLLQSSAIDMPRNECA
jgi:hypothetical protein